MQGVKRNRFYIGLSLFLLAGWAWLIYNLMYSPVDNLTVCIFKNVTGWPCPSCGTTRSVLAVMQGQLLEGLWLNPLGLLAVTSLIVLPLWLAYDLLRGKESLYSSIIAFEHYFKRYKLVPILFILFIAGNWIWNIYKHL
ncbi:MAG: DUF2752 domain-containing protein [Sphingobacteriales bacterium]|nr:MAG: DUF2752 domain-containing protein [Sphingobacteriales bacterium]